MMDHRLFSLGGFKATSSLSLSSLEISLCMYLTFSGKFINYVTFQSKTMSKLGSNSSAWRTIINLYSDKKVQKRMELLLYTLEFGLQVHTAYCRKCSVPNALSVMKNNMGSSTISKFKKGFQLWEGSFWGNCDILTSAPLLCLLEVEQVNFCTIIHCLALLTIKFSNLFLKRSPSQKMSGMEKKLHLLLLENLGISPA